LSRVHLYNRFLFLHQFRWTVARFMPAGLLRNSRSSQILAIRVGNHCSRFIFLHEFKELRKAVSGIASDFRIGPSNRLLQFTILGNLPAIPVHRFNRFEFRPRLIQVPNANSVIARISDSHVEPGCRVSIESNRNWSIFVWTVSSVDTSSKCVSTIAAVFWIFPSNLILAVRSFVTLH
jgi:hypothetical protein